MPRPAIPEQPDLFAWRTGADIEKRRTELTRRIKALKPNAWRRIELQAELARITADKLKMEMRK